MLTVQMLEQWVDRHVVDNEGHRLGVVVDIYVDDDSSRPEWIAIMTGLFGSRISFAPVEGAIEVDDKVRIAFSKSLVKDSPNIESDGHLTPEEESRLYRHYGMRYGARVKITTTATAASEVADVDVPVDEAVARLRRRDAAAVDAIDLRSDSEGAPIGVAPPEGVDETGLDKRRP